MNSLLLFTLTSRWCAMSERDESAMFYFAREANTHVTKMNLSTNEEVVAFHATCAHDAINQIIRLLGRD